MLTTAGMGAMSEIAYAPIMCKCSAGPFEDREAWVAHVREGMPPIPRRKRPDFRRSEAEQSAMMDYIASHGIVGILPEETNGKGECI